MYAVTWSGHRSIQDLRVQANLEPNKTSHLIFFNFSKSSRYFCSTMLEMDWLNLPSLGSFFLFKNHSGILNWVGFCMMATKRAISAQVVRREIKYDEDGTCINLHLAHQQHLTENSTRGGTQHPFARSDMNMHCTQIGTCPSTPATTRYQHDTPSEED